MFLVFTFFPPEMMWWKVFHEQTDTKHTAMYVYILYSSFQNSSSWTSPVHWIQEAHPVVEANWEQEVAWRGSDHLLGSFQLHQGGGGDVV